MFDWFTKRARNMMARSKAAARRQGQAQVGVEHLLLGLLGDGDNTAVSVILRLDIDPDQLRDVVLENLAHGTAEATPAQMPFSHSARSALERALDEACDLDAQYIGTEHLLLGIIQDPGGPAGEATRELRMRIEEVRETAADRFEPPPLGPHGHGPLRSRRASGTDIHVLERELEQLKLDMLALRERARKIEKRLSKWGIPPEAE